MAFQEFITQLGRNFQVIYEQYNAHGQKVQAAGNKHGTNRQRRRLQLMPDRGRRTLEEA